MIDNSNITLSVFFPAVLKALRPIENYLGKIPLGGQYYVKGVKKV